MRLTSFDFEKELSNMLYEANQQGLSFIDVSSRDLHIRVGNYPGPDHRMPVCCDIMRKKMGANDIVLKEPPSGQGVIVVRYFLENERAELVKQFKNVGISEEELKKTKKKSAGDFIFLPKMTKQDERLERMILAIVGIPVVLGFFAFIIFLLLS